MSGTCPVCNGFRVVSKPCDLCNRPMQDCGKYTDYFDKYSAYEEIDTVKLTNHIQNDQSADLCAHLFYCSPCQKETIVLIDEEQGFEKQKETPLFFD
ncbi:hypothetical protein [Alteribacter aurantiacus]|uniref:hypothetical protein n=1 Tax=Alteribacter aurantiacus TaxID=254410 RepID=UPI000422466B|nr:hypothetical protein [Alteribacter aurantiacus]